MAFTSRTAGANPPALSDNELSLGLTLSNVGVDQFVFLDAPASADRFVSENASEPSTVGAVFEDHSSISSLRLKSCQK